MSEPGQRSVIVQLWLVRATPWLFAVLALNASLFLAWNLPPFMSADELAHFKRADIGAHGKLVGQRAQANGHQVAGGVIETGITTANVPFRDIRFHVARKVSAADYAAAQKGGWDSPAVMADFRNSAAYSPFFYVPASAAIVVGRTLHLSIIDTLYMARLAQALVCVVTGFAALLLAGRARLLLYSVLLLPMSVALYSGVTGDGMLITTTALGCALIGRAMSQERPVSNRELAGGAFCFALVGMQKAPYMLFGLIFLAVEAERPKLRWAAVGAVFATGLGWLAFTAAMVQLPLVRPDAQLNPGGQVLYLWTHPWAIPGLAAHTLATNAAAYRMTTIGVLGWLDTFLPRLYYSLAWFVLAVAAIASAPARLRARWLRVRWTAVLVLICVFGAIHAALYVVWNSVAAPVVEGVAGRYFLPLGCFLALALEGDRPLTPDAGFGRWLSVCLGGTVLAFPILSLAMIERAVILRYYLS